MLGLLAMASANLKPVNCSAETLILGSLCHVRMTLMDITSTEKVWAWLGRGNDERASDALKQVTRVRISLFSRCHPAPAWALIWQSNTKWRRKC